MYITSIDLLKSMNVSRAEEYYDMTSVMKVNVANKKDIN